MTLKSIIRKIIGAKENETIVDALKRKIIKIEKTFYKSKYTTEMLETALKACGITSGDIVMVHCAWRSMYNYNDTPEKLIDLLKELVGENGTILMPCYGADRKKFDVNNTPSNAGVLSEIFRLQSGVIRSCCTHFSVAGIGKKVDEILADHINSRYGFDEHSPLYKLEKYNNSKILFLGLGARPTKISIFHCAGALLRNQDEKFNKLLSNEYESELIIDGTIYKKKMYIREIGHKNDTKSFKKIFMSIKDKKIVKLSNLDIVVINAKEAFCQAVKYAKKGVYCYKNMKQY